MSSWCKIFTALIPIFFNKEVGSRPLSPHYTIMHNYFQFTSREEDELTNTFVIISLGTEAEVWTCASLLCTFRENAFWRSGFTLFSWRVATLLQKLLHINLNHTMDNVNTFLWRNVNKEKKWKLSQFLDYLKDTLMLRLSKHYFNKGIQRRYIF